MITFQQQKTLDLKSSMYNTIILVHSKISNSTSTLHRKQSGAQAVWSATLIYLHYGAVVLTTSGSTGDSRTVTGGFSQVLLEETTCELENVGTQRSCS